MPPQNHVIPDGNSFVTGQTLSPQNVIIGSGGGKAAGKEDEDDDDDDDNGDYVLGLEVTVGLLALVELGTAVALAQGCLYTKSCK